MAILPVEFDPAHIQANSPPAAYMYGDDPMANEPMKSVLENNPEICFVPPKRGAEWGTWEFKPGSYYETTTGSKHSYWRDIDLPSPTKDIDQRSQIYYEGQSRAAARGDHLDRAEKACG